MAGTVYFAIGDVHGESAKLHALHDAILDRIVFEKLPARIIHLGDYVDRGPDSRGVIERVMTLEAKFAGSKTVEVISLMGNHEQMMLDAYDAPGDAGNWWSQGGAEAADSYAGGSGLADANWRETIPREHITWLRHLPRMYRDEDRRLVFVHAGIDPATFPDCSEGVRLWTRSNNFFDHDRWPKREELRNLLVIHGHTPKSYQPELFPHRINVDTGAVFGGPLTAVMLKDDEEPLFLRAGG
jgi:serine/threonine protein phosphatase 1